jgi:uncharacterized cupredoxin-like copper-binding protein
MKPTTLYFSMTLAAFVVAGAAASHDDKSEHHGHAAASAAPYGRPADPADAKRTIAIDMSDQLRFTPAQVSVQKGEIVRFVVKNSGKLEHEFVLGTLPELKEHAQVMQKHPGMEHDAPHMAHVAPGKARSITWQFTESGEFFYGCLVPGHFEAGMAGKVVVR